MHTRIIESKLSDGSQVYAVRIVATDGHARIDVDCVDQAQAWKLQDILANTPQHATAPVAPLPHNWFRAGVRS